MEEMRVNLEVSGLVVSAYLTDEGFVVDVFDEEECIATGYELFGEVGLEPPQPMEIDD
jgi:hypothetical protein